MAILRYLSKSMDGLESVQEVVDWNTNASDNSPSNDNARWNIVGMFRKNNNSNRVASVAPQQKQKKTGRDDLRHRKSMPLTTLDKLELNAANDQQQKVISTNANSGKGKLPRTVSFQNHSCPNIDFGPLAESEQSGLDDSITDGCSVVSEVTMMTYSNEKANMIKDEFFKRIREQGSKTDNPVAYVTSLSTAQREAMLREIQEEQEQTFRHVALNSKKIKTNKNKSTHSSDYFELQKQNVNEMNSPQAPRMIETRISNSTLLDKKKQGTADNRFSSFSSIATTKHGNKMTRAESSTATIKHGNHGSNSMRPIPHRNSQLRNDCFDSLTIQEKKPAPIFDLSTLYSASSASKTDSLLSSSLQYASSSLVSKTGEEKVEMNADPQDQDGDQEEVVHEDQMVQHEPEFFTREQRDEDLIAGGPQLVNIKEPQQQEIASVSTSSSSMARISDIIELKLLIANQQATIDTLASKLHNLELVNRRLELDASFHSTKSEGLLRQLSSASSSSMNNTSSSSTSSREEEYRNQQLVNENLELRRQLQDMKKFGNVGDSRNDRKFVVQ